MRRGSLLIRQSKSPQTLSSFGRALRCGGVRGKEAGTAERATISYGERAGDHGPADGRDVCRMARESSISIVSLRAGDSRGLLGGPIGTNSYGERVGVSGPAERGDVCWIAREASTSIVDLRAGDMGPLRGPIGEVIEGVPER